MNLFTKVTISVVLVYCAVACCVITKNVLKEDIFQSLEIVNMKVDSNSTHRTTTVYTEDGEVHTHITTIKNKKISSYDIEDMTIENLIKYLKHI